MLFLPILILLVALPNAPVRAESSYTELNHALTEHVVIPAYERMAEEMVDLRDTTEAFCRMPDVEGLNKAKDAFNLAMDAWQRAQPIGFGPVTIEGRSSRIQFWPDKSGTGARQVARALQDRDPALVAPGGLEGRSVALQNLSSYERILFDQGDAIASGDTSDEATYACDLAAAIGRFQADLSGIILQEWVEPGGYRDAMFTATEGNAHYGGADEAAADLLKSLFGTLDFIIARKLERPLGKEIEKARPKRAESWRSGRSLANIRANLETAQALYESPGGFGDLLSAAGAEPLDLGLRDIFADIIVRVQDIGLPLREAVKDPEARAELLAIRDQLKDLRLLVGGPVAEEIGLIVGFNALDGD